MAGRNATVGVTVKAESDFTQARREAERELDKIERAADDIVLSPELDTTEIRKAIDLAKQLDGLTAEMTVDADISEIVEAEKLAKSLRAFQARVNLSVEGKAELTEALNLSEQMDRIRTVRVEVQGRQDLERAAQIADDLERRRTVPIDAQASDLVRLDDQVGEALTRGGEAGAEGVAGALGDIDFADIGSSGLDQLTGALAAAGPWAAVGGTVGAIFGDEFLAGFNNALPDSRGDTIRALRNNLSGSELADVGRVGGEAYSAGLAEGLTGAKDAAALIQGELAGIDDGLNLDEVTRQALALEQVFGVDLAESVASVDKLVSQGLVKNSQEGFNLLFELGQQTGTQFDEMLELTNEFSTAIKALGIEGPKGLKLIGEMVEQGIFPQVDQAGEVFEELNETIVNGGAHDALQELTGDASGFEQAVAGGGFEAASAVAELASKLLDVDDNAKQAQLTTAIFGGNMGLLGDDAREAALQLFATADGTEAVGTAASDAATSIEESASGLDRLKKVAVDLGDELGTTVADGIDTLNSLAEMDFSAAADSAASFGEALGIKLLGPLGELSNRVGLNPFGPLKDAIDELTGSADDVDFEPAVAGAEALSTAAREGAPQLEDMADGVDTLTVSAEDAAAAVDELEAQLRGLFNFNADQLLRDVAAAGDDLAESFKNGAAATVGMNGEIDVSTEAGRRLQGQLEDLNGTLVDAAVALANGDIEAADFARIQDEVTAQLGRTAGQADLTSSKVQGLTDKYNNQAAIGSVVVDLVANDQATAVVKNLQNALANLPSQKTVTVTTRNVIIAATAATAQARAKGGWTEGLTLVGEEGPELIDVKGRAFVHTAGETRQLLSNRGGDLGGGAPLASIASGPRINIERLVVDKGVDLWQQLDLAEMVYGHR